MADNQVEKCDDFGEFVLSLAARCDSGSGPGMAECLPLYCDGVVAGLVKPHIAPLLTAHSDTFQPLAEGISLSPALLSVQQRTDAINKVFSQIRDSGKFPWLKWRDENYRVSEMFSSPTAMFHCERAAAKLLGVRVYGVHMNGFVRCGDGELRLWIGRRSASKQTYPGLLDNTVAGGIAAGDSPLETLVRESAEEASIPEALARQAVAVGTISYCHDTPDGLELETEFIYDLELPDGFSPTPADGEVSHYYLWTVEQVKREIVKDQFKPNCALTLLKFMIRHSLTTPESEPLYEQLCACAHINHYCPTRLRR